MAALIGLDWGSTSLRAMLIDGQGAVLEARYSEAGASTLTGGAAGFCAALDALIGDWHASEWPILACGMVGSAHGWQEVAYQACPAEPARLASGIAQVDWRGRAVGLVPGLRFDAQTPDVMRGEETQVLGALALHPALAARSCIVMPGTHSKWARVQDGAVRAFATHMTGELFAVLRQHSVLGRLMPAAATDADAAAFAEGVRAAREHGDEGLTHQLFAVRTLGLTGKLNSTSLPDYLSGLLIGHELRAGLQWRDRAGLAAAPLVLIGEPALCQRYAQALEGFGHGAAQTLPNTAAAGLHALARALKEHAP